LTGPTLQCLHGDTADIELVWLLHGRHFMPAMLMYPGNRGWPAFQALLRGLLRFLEPYLRNAQLTEAIRLLYKVGTLHK
jgi:CCR4-NOT transcription complex subunit 1